MKLKHRLCLALTGAVLSLYGASMMRLHRFSYQNHYAMTLYSPGVIALGVFFLLLAFLPPTSLIERLTRKAKTNQDHQGRINRA